MTNQMCKSWQCVGAYFCIIALLCRLNLVVNSKSNYDICHEKGQANFALNLTGAMVFPDYILLIDNTSMVYEMPLASLHSYGSMDLTSTGMHIEDKWPAFRGNQLWKEIQSKYKDIYHCVDEQNNSWIYMDQMPGKGLRYSLNEETIVAGFDYSGQEREQLILDDAATRVYTIKMQKGAQELAVPIPPVINVWKFTPDGTGVQGRALPIGFQVYYLIDKRNSSQRNITVFNRREFESPYTTEENPLVGRTGFENYRLENVTKDWHIDEGHIPVGFIYKGHFHLFDYDKILIFADAMPTYEELVNGENWKEGKFKNDLLLMNVQLEVISVKNYFRCVSEVAPLGRITYPPPNMAENSNLRKTRSRPNGTTKQPSHKTGISSTTEAPGLVGFIIVIILVFLILLIVCLCLFLQSSSPPTNTAIPKASASKEKMNIFYPPKEEKTWTMTMEKARKMGNWPKGPITSPAIPLLKRDTTTESIKGDPIETPLNAPPLPGPKCKSEQPGAGKRLVPKGKSSQEVYKTCLADANPALFQTPKTSKNLPKTTPPKTLPFKCTEKFKHVPSEGEAHQRKSNSLTLALWNHKSDDTQKTLPSLLENPLPSAVSEVAISKESLYVTSVNQKLLNSPKVLANGKLSMPPLVANEYGTSSVIRARSSAANALPGFKSPDPTHYKSTISQIGHSTQEEELLKAKWQAKSGLAKGSALNTENSILSAVSPSDTVSSALGKFPSKCKETHTAN